MEAFLVAVSTWWSRCERLLDKTSPHAISRVFRAQIRNIRSHHRFPPVTSDDQIKFANRRSDFQLWCRGLWINNLLNIDFKSHHVGWEPLIKVLPKITVKMTVSSDWLLWKLISSDLPKQVYIDTAQCATPCMESRIEQLDHSNFCAHSMQHVRNAEATEWRANNSNSLTYSNVALFLINHLLLLFGIICNYI